MDTRRRVTALSIAGCQECQEDAISYEEKLHTLWLARLERDDPGIEALELAVSRREVGRPSPAILPARDVVIVCDVQSASTREIAVKDCASPFNITRRFTDKSITYISALNL